MNLVLRTRSWRWRLSLSGGRGMTSVGPERGIGLFDPDGCTNFRLKLQ